MRFFLHLSYKGANYSGWQKQKSTGMTVQEVIEQTLRKIYKISIPVHGCGRTDAGVHASQYFLHLDLPEEMKDEDLNILNRNLPDDIVIYECIPVHEKANAQKDAVLRRYSYYFHTEKQVFLNDISLLITDDQLDFQALKDGLGLIRTNKDFAILCKRPDQYKDTNCQIFSAELIQTAPSNWCIEISANRFLQGMMRLIVGNLLEIARSKYGLDYLSKCLTTNQRPQFYNAAFPQGLHLSKVEYPYLKRKNSCKSLN